MAAEIVVKQQSPDAPSPKSNDSGSGTSGPENVRKNSIANNAVGGSGGVGAAASRPRANTISHLDLTSLGVTDGMTQTNTRISPMGMNHPTHRFSMSGLPGPGGFDYRGMSSTNGQHGNIHNLPKLDTHGINTDFNDMSLRTAPPYAGLGGFDLDQLFTPGNGSTVNPAQLHFGNAAQSPTAFPNFQQFNTIPDVLEQDDDFGWMRGWDVTTQLNGTNEHAIDESSPSGMSSTASQNGYRDTMMDLSTGNVQQNWGPSDLSPQPLMTPAVFSLDTLGTGLPNLDTPAGTVSPQNLHDNAIPTDTYFQGALKQNGHAKLMNGIPLNPYMPPLSNFGSDSPSMSSSSVTGSARQSSVTSVSTDSITDATRQALLISLSQPSVFGHNHRKYSQPTISSPLSPGGAMRTSVHGPTLPSTSDLQRYVNAYIQYFHPHLPFLHIPTLSFDSQDYVSNIRSSSGQVSFGHAGIVGGGGCLILAMAAIGALYEYDHQASRELFDSAKKMIQLYLEERRKADMSAAVNGTYIGAENANHNTPLWLVQAMLLNVIYGHNCGDKTAADIASTHCAALVSLARAAELAQPPGEAQGDTNGNNLRPVDTHQEGEAIDVKMSEDFSPFSDHKPQSFQKDDMTYAWLSWKETEERKRTLFAVFILSSLLVTAYNHTPAIMNSEILLDLPCEEDLWAADSAQDWMAKGGAQAAEQNALPFSTALSTLLTASQRHPAQYRFNPYAHEGSGYMDGGQTEAELRPSTFGCLVLINALHNYIWETRSRHHGRQWTAAETESMFSHIEPALNAWQAAWKANDHHRLQRPNVFGHGPLSADSIPLLDLAFVRLFVNLGRSKEAFWQRDYDSMATELARGAEIVQHADRGSSRSTSQHSASSSPENLSGSPNQHQSARPSSQSSSSSQGTKRERHLRKAAFYAADSLTISAQFNLTYADAASHELPIQSAMCFFDCSQVLAEWACTVQERVGRYLGVLGKSDVDYSQVPAIMLLETEDTELLGKIENICSMLEDKMLLQANILAREMASLDPAAAAQLHNTMSSLPGLGECGLGSRILRVTAYMLEKAAVWPGKWNILVSTTLSQTFLDFSSVKSFPNVQIAVTHVMASALEIQAVRMNQRAEASITQ
ncbi:hypothetical protein M8818_000475 [Zalaria obscura]|uniref:Uncharacterized protein n=1 Tax=Zalaria obscura TaxID=2024903 RepID=A0ACC3SMZ5_9PEZI